MTKVLVFKSFFRKENTLKKLQQWRRLMRCTISTEVAQRELRPLLLSTQQAAKDSQQETEWKLLFHILNSTLSFCFPLTNLKKKKNNCTHSWRCPVDSLRGTQSKPGLKTTNHLKKQLLASPLWKKNSSNTRNSFFSPFADVRVCSQRTCSSRTHGLPHKSPPGTERLTNVYLCQILYFNYSLFTATWLN